MAAVYNLRVAEDHTYFVGAEDWGFSVWAHNTCINIGGDVDDVRPGAVIVQPGRIGGDAELALENAQRIREATGERVIMADPTRLPFPDNSIDEVITNNVPIHPPDPPVGYFGPSPTPEEIQRILKSDGVWTGSSSRR